MSGHYMQSLFLWRIILTRFFVGPLIRFIEIHKFVEYLPMKSMNIHVEINYTQTYFAGSDSQPAHNVYDSQFRKMCLVIFVVKSKLSLCKLWNLWMAGGIAPLMLKLHIVKWLVKFTQWPLYSQAYNPSSTHSV